ncbi:DUF1820 family protein [Piscirickettsia salmonis]|uniref:DUF1820 family protein n=1 Tax=Piscirickettsia salmonis TaxID=1238 RepID=UPI001EE4A4BA|nr:DUF1820 family protein [Piscirickettsia salmonis]
MSEVMTDNTMYKVVFINQGATYEIYAKQVSQSNLFGFIEVEEYIFERSTILIDPAEERLQAEFADVKRSYIPVGAIIRIDEVEKRALLKFMNIRIATANQRVMLRRFQIIFMAADLIQNNVFL